MDRQSLLKSLDAEIVDATAYSLASPSAALVNGGVGGRGALTLDCDCQPGACIGTAKGADTV
jgi:hypothetical protein